MDAAKGMARTAEFLWTVIVAGGSAFLIAVALMMGLASGWFFTVVAVLWGVFWLVQFCHLMTFSPRRFPAPYDKIIWVVVFLLLAPVAPLAFWVWKQWPREEAV